MDNQRIKGAAQRLKGNIKSTVGRLTGNTQLEASGEADKAAGSVRTTVGKATDAVRDITRPRKI